MLYPAELRDREIEPLRNSARGLKPDSPVPRQSIRPRLGFVKHSRRV